MPERMDQHQMVGPADQRLRLDDGGGRLVFEGRGRADQRKLQRAHTDAPDLPSCADRALTVGLGDRRAEALRARIGMAVDDEDTFAHAIHRTPGLGRAP